MSRTLESILGLDQEITSQPLMKSAVGFSGSIYFRERGDNGKGTSKKVRPASAGVPKSTKKLGWVSHKPKGAK